MKSIRRQIIFYIVVSLVVVNIISAIYLYTIINDEVDEILDAEQAQYARMIDSVIENVVQAGYKKNIVANTLSDTSGLDSIVTHPYEHKMAYQIWDNSGNIILMSHNAPLYPLSASRPGFSNIRYNSTSWRVFALYSNVNEKWIYTAQESSVRNELIVLLIKEQFISLFIVNIIVLFTVIFAVIKGTAPISLLGNQLKKRDSSNLSTIEMVVPKELEPLKNAANLMLKQLDASFTQEKNFNADVAHELRTPLAAIKIHAQNIELRNTLDSAGKKSLERLIYGVGNMTTIVEQLLLLSRLTSSNKSMIDNTQQINLLHIARTAVTQIPVNILSSYHFEVTGDDCIIKGNEALLITMVRNLIENAYKYSPKSTTILIKAYLNKNNKPCIAIIDEGTGMTDEQKKTALTRYARFSDTQTYGSGIGLSIVLRIIEYHNAQLLFEDNKIKQGLICKIIFSDSLKIA